MQITLLHNNQKYQANLNKPIDISIVLKNGSQNPNCFFAPNPLFTPVKTNDFIGDTKQGGAVNFFNIQINPHGNGTHTECVGHVSKETFFINDCLKTFHSIGLLITLEPTIIKNDTVITKTDLEKKLNISNNTIETLIIRTFPNNESKLIQNYSNTNPTYFQNDAMQFIVDLGFQHLIIDLPSVDKEKDGGKLSAHHIFWNYPLNTRTNATITEMVFIPNQIKDGLYLINHQIMPIELDASSSRIILFELNTLS